MEKSEVFYGMVVFFSNKLNYGFIKPEIDGKDVFVHYSAVNPESCPTGFRTLKKDAQVSYELGTNNKGQLVAVNVTVLK